MTLILPSTATFRCSFAEDVLAGGAAQHLADIDALQCAGDVDRHRVLRGIDRAREVDGAAVELAVSLDTLKTPLRNVASMSA